MKYKKWHLVCLLIAFAKIAPSASEKLPRVADDLSILARIVKGIAIGETLNKNSSKLDSLVGEVFNLGQGVTMDTLANMKIEELDTDLGVVDMEVEKQCGKNNECGDVAGIVQGIRVLEDIRAIVGEAESVLKKTSHLYQTVELKKHLGTLVDAETSANELVAKIDEIATAPEDATLYAFLKGLGEKTAAVEKSREAFEVTKSMASVVKLANVLEDLKSLNNIGNIPSMFSKSVGVFDQMKLGLTDMKQKLGVLKSLFSQKTLGSITGKLDSLSDLITSQTDGMSDEGDALEELSRDMRTTFVKDTLGKGQNVEESLSEVLKPIETLRKQLESLRNSWETTEFSVANRVNVEHLKNELLSIEKSFSSPVLDSIANFESPGTCFGTMSLTTQFSSISWANAPNELNGLDAHTESWQKNVAPLKPFSSLVEFPNFAKLLENLGNTVEENKNQLGTLKQFPKTQEVKQELSQLITQLNSMNGSPLNGLLQSSSMDKVFPHVENWMTKSGVQTALKCLKDHPTLTSSALSSISFNFLSNLKSDSHVVKPVRLMTSALKTSLGEWTKIRSSNSTTKTKRNAKKSLLNAEKLSKELSEGVKIIRNLAEVQKKRVDIQKLVTDEATISTAVSGVKDQTKKAQIDKIWTDETKKSLKGLPDIVNNLETSIDKSSETISDYQKVFASAKSLSYPNINTKDLESALDTITDPPGIQSTLHSIATLDLQFVDATNRLTAASEALKPLQKFFDEALESDGAVAAQKQIGGTATPVTKSQNWISYPESIVFIILFVAATIVSVVFGFLYCQLKKKGGDKKADKKTDKKKTGKEKDLEKGKKKTGKTDGKKKSNKGKSSTSASSGPASVAAQPAPAGQNPNQKPAPPAPAPAQPAAAPVDPAAPNQNAAPAPDAPEAPSQDQPAPSVENPAEGNGQNAPEPKGANFSQDDTLRGTPDFPE